MTFSFTSLCDVNTLKREDNDESLENQKDKISFNGSLIQFDDFTILLDPGWMVANEGTKSQTETETELETKVKQEVTDDTKTGGKLYQSLVEFWTPVMEDVDLILISQSSIDCLGSLIFLFTHFQSKIYHEDIKIYSTLPVINLGRISTIELYCSLQLTGPFYSSLIDLEDIENGFDYITSIKYSQTIQIPQFTSDKLSFTAYSSGYSIGGCCYCVESSQEKIIYSPRWSHTKDTLVNGTAMLDPINNLQPVKPLMKPSCFIGSLKYLTEQKNSLPLRRRTNILKKFFKETLIGNNCIIIPTSIGLNFLNIFAVLNDYLNDLKGRRNDHNGNGNNNNNRYAQYQNSQNSIPVYLVSYSKGRSITYARSMLEWLSSDVVKQWQLRDNKTPFDLDLKVLSPFEFAKEKNSIINKGGIIFVSEQEMLFNQILTSFISNNQMLRNCHVLMTTSFNNSSLIQDMLETCEKDIEYNKVVFLKEYSSATVTDDEFIKYSDSIKERISKRKNLKYEYETIQEANKKQNLNDLLKEDSDDDDDDDDEVDTDEEEGEQDEKDSEDKDDSGKGKKNNESSEPKDVYHEDGELKIPMDIIVKENAPVKQQMFPYKLSKFFRKDEYGVVVDFSQFIPIDENEDDYVMEGLKRSHGDAKLGSDSDDDDQEEDNDDYDPTATVSKKNSSNKKKTTQKERDSQNFDDISYLEPMDGQPLKSNIVFTKYKISCKIEYIDMSSFIDKRSMDIILPSFQPKKLVLVESLDTMAQAQYPNIETIIINDNNEHVFTTSIKTLDITISQELENSVHWQSVLNGKYKITNVLGRLVEITSKETHLAGGSKPKLELKPLDEKIKTTFGQDHQNNDLHLGDVKLNQLKELLTQKNHRAQFKGDGTLVIDNTVFIKKISDSVTVIDGKPSELFYFVKKTVADTLATI